MPSAYSGPERRRSVRIAVRFILTYQVHEPIKVRMWIGNKEVSALMLDLSPEGMAILTQYEIPLATILAMSFTLINLQAEKDKQMRSMGIMGEVRYASQEGYEQRLGISFTHIGKEDKVAIASFITAARNE
ncbi:PilZ domain-containing protein [Candidatus Omnitrophota bacterium]